MFIIIFWDKIFLYSLGGSLSVEGLQKNIKDQQKCAIGLFDIIIDIVIITESIAIFLVKWINFLDLFLAHAFV